MLRLTFTFPQGEPLQVEPDSFVFPGGEVQIRIPQACLERVAGSVGVELFALLQSSADVMRLLMVTDAVRRITPAPVSLSMPYIPYARQDRVANPGEALSIKVFASLINAQNYSSVTVLDPHSHVSEALLDRLVVNTPLAMLRKILSTSRFAQAEAVTLLAPDQGAVKRVSELVRQLSAQFPNLSFAAASKVRDPLSGRVSQVSVDPKDLRGEVLVVDDICDGGSTFLQLADVIWAGSSCKEMSGLSLYVSHGIFSKNAVDRLAESFDAIYAAHSWVASDKVTVLAN